MRYLQTSTHLSITSSLSQANSCPTSAVTGILLHSSSYSTQHSQPAQFAACFIFVKASSSAPVPAMYLKLSSRPAFCLSSDICLRIFITLSHRTASFWLAKISQVIPLCLNRITSFRPHARSCSRLDNCEKYYTVRILSWMSLPLRCHTTELFL